MHKFAPISKLSRWKANNLIPHVCVRHLRGTGRALGDDDRGLGREKVLGNERGEIESMSVGVCAG